MKKIIIAGGTGFLGTSLANHFNALGYQVIILSRQKSLFSDNKLIYEFWDGVNLDEWAKTLENAAAVINLSGKSVDCRYNEKNKKAIFASRLEATKAIGLAIQQCQHPPKVWINAASATIYKDTRENEPANGEKDGIVGEGFSVEVCKQWEAIFWQMQTPQTRKIIQRTAIVLGKNGGAFPMLKKLVNFGLGGKQGSGEQWMSWLHIQDYINITQWMIDNSKTEGVFNCVSPNAVKNKYFMQILRKIEKRSLGIPTPAWLLKIGAVLIQTEPELVLKSRKVYPQRLLEENFNFKYAHLEETLASFT